MYLAAKEIDLLGPEAPEFQEVFLKLQTASPLIAGDCSRRLAGRIINVLRRHGIPARMQPLRRPAKKEKAAGHPLLRFRLEMKRSLAFLGELSPAVRMTLILILILCSGLFLAALKFHAGAGEDLSPQPAADADGDSLPLKDLLFRAGRSNVEITVKDGQVTAFFVAPQLLLAPSRVAEDTVTVSLPDGRKLPARVERNDPWIGVALLRVAGADEAFLRLGDATRLERGQPLILSGRPRGGGMVATQGVLTGVDHVDLGRDYLILEAKSAVEGSPILDDTARVVGIMTAGITKREGSHAAIPVNYVTDGEKALFPQPRDLAAAARWRKTLEKIRLEDDAGYRKFRTARDRPFLLKAEKKAAEIITVTLWKFQARTPAPEELFFDIRRGREILCRLPVNSGPWREFSGKDGEELFRWNQWLQHHDPRGRLFVAKPELVSWACRGEISGAELVLASGNPDGSHVRIED